MPTRTAIRYLTLHFRDTRGAASLRYRNRAEQKPYPVWFSRRRKSCPVLYEHLSDMWIPTLEIGASQLHSVTEIAPKSPFLWVNRSPIRYGFRAGAKAFPPVLCEKGLRTVHTEHVTTATRNLPSWQSQGTDECCDSWLVLSPDRSFLGGSFPTGKQAQAPNDDKWNPLQTGNKGKT